MGTQSKGYHSSFEPSLNKKIICRGYLIFMLAKPLAILETKNQICFPDWVVSQDLVKARPLGKGKTVIWG